MAPGSSFAFLDVPNRGVPDRRHSSEHPRATTPSVSRKSSTTSLSSQKSEPGWLAAMNGVDRSRAESVPTKSSAGLSKFFGKNKTKSDKKDSDQIVLTSKHTAAVKSKLALDPRYKNVRKDSSPAVPHVAGPQTGVHMTAQQQEMRHPHSGPPALYAPTDKSDMPMLSRIISGDEADEPDEWERMRDDWRQRKIPTMAMTQVIEGEVLEDDDGGETTTPGENEKEKAKEGLEDVDIPESMVVERQGIRILSVASISLEGDEYQPRPERAHTPIGGRWKKDDKGVWKR